MSINRINSDEEYVKHFHGKFLWNNSDGDEVWECSCGKTVIIKKQNTIEKEGN